MNKSFRRDLQAQLFGEISTSEALTLELSTDAGLYQRRPEGVVYPANTADVRKTLRLLSEHTAAGKPASLTPRGGGSSLVGGATGEGLQLMLTAHMTDALNRTKDTVTIQPGMNLGALQRLLRSHGRWLPVYPASLHYSTVGGAVASAASGLKSVKYGSIHDWVLSLKVVLSDGSIIETRRLSTRELKRKKGQTDLEGHIYRGLDGLLLDHADLIARKTPAVLASPVGYALSRVKRRDESFDLTPIFIGSEGTLGVITELTLRTASLHPNTALLAGACDDYHQAAELIAKLRELRPSALELVGQAALELLRRHRPHELEGLLPDGKLPALALLVEFDDLSRVAQTLRVHRAQRLLAKFGTHLRTATDPVAQAALWNLRTGPAGLVWSADNTKPAVPVMPGAAVPLDRLGPFLSRTERLLSKHTVEAPFWGAAGTGQIQVWPLLDITKKKDRDLLGALTEDFSALIADLGGTLGTFGGDGLAGAAHLERFLGADLAQVHREVKTVFDPDHRLNPGVKVGPFPDPTLHLRDDYHLARFAPYAPYS